MIRSGFSHIPTDQPHRQSASNYRKSPGNPAARSLEVFAVIVVLARGPELPDMLPS